MATLDLGQVVGKSAYEYAVDGGYAGTEEEFQALMADSATKTYVDALFNQVAPVIMKVQLGPADTSNHSDITSVEKSYNVKCYPANTENSTYTINFTIPNIGSDRKVRIVPPDNYAFTGLYSSSGIIVRANDGDMQNYLRINSNGTATSDVYVSSGQTIVGTFTLEVA